MEELQEYLDIKLKEVVFNDDGEQTEEIDDYDVEKELAELIVRIRNEQGITQKDLSRLTGMQQSNISKIENCEGNPSVKILKRIAKGLNKKLIITMEWWKWKKW